MSKPREDYEADLANMNKYDPAEANNIMLKMAVEILLDIREEAEQINSNTQALALKE